MRCRPRGPREVRPPGAGRPPAPRDPPRPSSARTQEHALCQRCHRRAAFRGLSVTAGPPATGSGHGDPGAPRQALSGLDSDPHEDTALERGLVPWRCGRGARPGVGAQCPCGRVSGAARLGSRARGSPGGRAARPEDHAPGASRDRASRSPRCRCRRRSCAISVSSRRRTTGSTRPSTTCSSASGGRDSHLPGPRGKAPWSGKPAEPRVALVHRGRIHAVPGEGLRSRQHDVFDRVGEGPAGHDVDRVRRGAHSG